MLVWWQALCAPLRRQRKRWCTQGRVGFRLCMRGSTPLARVTICCFAPVGRGCFSGVQDLVSPCLRPRHWFALSQAVHTKNSLYLGYARLVRMPLRDIMKLNLHEHITVVRQVGATTGQTMRARSRATCRSWCRHRQPMREPLALGMHECIGRTFHIPPPPPPPPQILDSAVAEAAVEAMLQRVESFWSLARVTLCTLPSAAVVRQAHGQAAVVSAPMPVPGAGTAATAPGDKAGQAAPEPAPAAKRWPDSPATAGRVWASNAGAEIGDKAAAASAALAAAAAPAHTAVSQDPSGSAGVVVVLDVDAPENSALLEALEVGSARDRGDSLGLGC
jgi:hypothetical protein